MDVEPVGPGTVCEGRFDDDAEGFAVQARQALRDRMLVVCAHCSARIRVAKRLAGHVIHCTSCSKELRVPDTAAEDQVDISYLISPADIVMGQDPRRGMSRRQRARRRQRKFTSQKRFQLALKFAGALMFVFLVGSVIWRGTDSPAPEMDYISREPFDEPEATTKTTPPEPAPANIAPPTPAGPTASLAGDATFSPFASGGYYPAKPNRLYCVLPVRIQSSAEEPLRISPAGAARLKLDGVSYACLGEFVPNTQLPLLARQRTVALPPHTATTLQLLFELPQKEHRGTLQLDSLGELAVTLPAPAPAKTSPAGRFVEVAPRNLKVLLDDPVMAAIQSTARQELLIRENGTLLDVRIPAAEVIGQARPVGANAYAVVLRHGPHSIEGTLRLLPDGRRIVLYLSNDPMHQMTYQRKISADTTPGETTSPTNNEDKNQPRFFGV
jgi:hypothetical protein